MSDTDCIIFRHYNVHISLLGWEHVIPEIMIKIQKASDNFTKSNIELQIQGDGRETRAFCYIDNAVEGFILCGEKGGDCEIYHVGEMDEITILNLIQQIGKALRINIDIIPGELRPGGTPRRCPDIAKLANLGYSPSVSFGAGLGQSVDWYKHYLLLNQ